MRSQTWQFVSRLVVRRAGFPFEMLDGLAFQESSLSVDRLLTLEEAVEAEKRLLLEKHFRQMVRQCQQQKDKAGLKLLSKYRREVAKQQIDASDVKLVQTCWPGTTFAKSMATFRSLISQAQEIEQWAQQVFAQELRDRRRNLQEILRTPEIAEALFISNPDIVLNSYAAFVKQHEFAQRPAHIRTLERRFTSYLQRFAAKNDTASFFGPMNYARFDREQEEALLLKTVPGKYRKRAVFYAFWMVSALADCISQEPAIYPYLVPCLHPLCQLTEDGVHYPLMAARRRLPEQLRQLARAIDGRITLKELARRHCLTLAELRPLIQQLVDLRVVLLRIDIPSTVFNPFACLKRFLLALPDACEARERWLRELEQFEEWIDAFVDADLQERIQLTGEMERAFSRLTQQKARRLSGQMYADRTLYYEECAGTIQTFSFGKAFCEDFERRLKPIMDLCAAYGEILRAHYQAIGKRIFTTIAGHQNEISYAAFIRGIRACEEAGMTYDDDPLHTHVHAALASLVRAKQHGGVARLAEEDLRFLRCFDRGEALHASPDLLFAATSQEELARGNYQLVLGEMHQFIAMWGSQLLFDPEREEVEAEVEEIMRTLPAYHNITAVLNTRKHKGLLYEAFPGKLVQLFGKPSERAREVLAFNDLVVRMQGDELALIHKPTGERLMIYTGGDEQLHLWTFALPRVMPIPVDFGEHTPRIEINGVVYQRERWHLQREHFILPDAQDTDYQIFRKMRAAQKRYGLPRRGFVRVPGEKKPYFLDFDNFFTVELVYHKLKHNDTLTFVEMAPGADQLWLKDDMGSYCLEVRGTAFRHPAPEIAQAANAREAQGGRI